ncbi:MAG: hypothetical protein ACOX8X_06750 [Methanomethylophilus sp.]
MGLSSPCDSRSCRRAGGSGTCPNPEETADKVLRQSRIYLAAVTVAMIAVAVAVAVYI